MFGRNEFKTRVEAMTTEQIKNNLFLLWMKDHWNQNDWSQYHIMENELENRK